MKKLVTIDLFAGVGGISMGLMSTRRYEVVALTDSDKIAKKVFERNYPPDRQGSPKYICKPIAELTPEELREAARGRVIDVCVGGPPCTGFSQSVATKRTYEDERNHLFKKYFEIVETLRPKALILENVPEFLILFEGRIFKELRDRLNELNYECAVDFLNAARYGVPQSRQRVIIVAIRRDLGVRPLLPDPTHGGSDIPLFSYVTRDFIEAGEELLRNPAKYESTYDDTIMGVNSIVSVWRTRHLLNKNGYSLDGSALAHYPCQMKRGRPRRLLPLVTVEEALSDLPPLQPGERSSRYASPPLNDYQTARRKGVRRLTNHKAWQHSASMVARLEHVLEGGNISDIPEELRPAKWYSQAYARLHRNALSRTITTFFHNPGSGRFTHYEQARTLTVREAARLQSFDDRIKFNDTDTNHERLIGNAVPPLLVRAVGQQLYNDLERVLRQ